MARILIAEPDRDGRELLASALSAAGHAVRACEDAYVALAGGLEWSPEVVMLAVALPKGRPQEVLRRLARAGCVPRRIIGLDRHGGDAGALPEAHAWLRWPIDPRELLELADAPA